MIIALNKKVDEILKILSTEKDIDYKYLIMILNYKIIELQDDYYNDEISFEVFKYGTIVLNEMIEELKHLIDYRKIDQKKN